MISWEPELLSLLEGLHVVRGATPYGLSEVCCAPKALQNLEMDDGNNKKLPCRERGYRTCRKALAELQCVLTLMVQV